MKIGVVNNSLKGETRVAVTPLTTALYAKEGLQVVVEKGAGEKSGFCDDAYIQNKATLGSRTDILKCEIILSVLPPKKSDLFSFKEGQWLVCDLTSFDDKADMQDLVQTNIGVVDLGKMPRISRAQVMDVLSSQAMIAGYRAATKALEMLSKTAPLLMSAAGTLVPAKAFVIGAGVAGLEAVSVLKRMGVNVYATDVRQESQVEVESVGGKFLQDLSVAFDGVDILITSAFSAGKKVPPIVFEKELAKLSKNAVVIDMAEGNVEDLKMRSDIRFLKNRHLERELAYSASMLFANNVYAFLKMFDFMGSKADFEDEIMKSVLTCADGFLRGKLR